MDQNSKKAKWLFEVDIDNDGTYDYFWSITDCSYDGQDYDYKIISFDSLVLQMPDFINGDIPQNKINIKVFFKDSNVGGYYASDFEGKNLIVRLVMKADLREDLYPGDDISQEEDLYESSNVQEEEILSWKFVIEKASSVDQVLSLECVDFFTNVLDGDYPNTPLASEIFPAALMKSDNYCLPKLWGKPYIPVRFCLFKQDAAYISSTKFQVVGNYTTLYTNGQFLQANCGTDGIKRCHVSSSVYTFPYTQVTLDNSTSQALTSNLTNVIIDNYLLGYDSGTYSVWEVRSPQEWSGLTIYNASDYTFKRYTITQDSTDYKMCQLIIADEDGDGTNDQNGYFGISSKEIYDVPFLISNSNTSSTKNPVYILSDILQDIGISASDIDTITESNIASTLASRGILLNVGLYYRQSRKEIISKLCRISHIIPVYRDKIYWKALTSDSQLAVEEDLIKPHSFSITDNFIFREKHKDSCYCYWQTANYPQDFPKNKENYQGTVNRGVVPAKSSTTERSDISLENEWCSSEYVAKKSAKLTIQREVLKDKTITFTAQAKILQLEPGDFITIRNQNQGVESAPYDALITKMVINPDLWVMVECVTFTDSINDWDDLTVSTNGAEYIQTEDGYSPVYQGPTDVGNASNKSNEITKAVLIGTNGELKTNNDPSSIGGFLATNQAIRCYNTDGEVRFEAIYNGADQGDVVVGNYSGGQGLKWDQNSGILDILGRIEADTGSIAGWDISETKIYKTGIELDSSVPRFRVESGSNYINISPDGIIGHDNVLGDTFILPTDGSAPQFSSGVIKECTYEIYTSGVIQTNAAPATNGGLLINNTSLTGYNTSGDIRFQAIYSGSNQGDVLIGDYSNSRGIFWDQSETTLQIKIDSSGGFYVAGGGDITLVGSDSDPGIINFQGTTYSTRIGVSTDGSDFYIGDSSESNVIDCFIGSFPLIDGSFKDIYLYALTDIYALCFDNIKLSAGINNEYQPSATIELQRDESAPYSYIRFSSRAGSDYVYWTFYQTGFALSDDKVLDFAGAGLALDDIYADDFQNVADFAFLDHRKEKDKILQVDDLDVIRNIKGSGVFDSRTGFEIIDDNTLPQWLLSKNKHTKEVLYDSEGKPYVALKNIISLLIGAVRELDEKVSNF